MYKTWCMNCEDMSKKEIDKMENKSDKEKRDLKRNISLYKYVGESSRSLYERGWEHEQDKNQLNTTSHMLKHIIQEHEGEDIEKIKFGIRTIQYCRSSFERQILEACKIQEERKKHTILDSRSEFNRSRYKRTRKEKKEVG